MLEFGILDEQTDQFFGRELCDSSFGTIFGKGKDLKGFFTTLDPAETNGGDIGARISGLLVTLAFGMDLTEAVF